MLDKIRLLFLCLCPLELFFFQSKTSRQCSMAAYLLPKKSRHEKKTSPVTRGFGCGNILSLHTSLVISPFRVGLHLPANLLIWAVGLHVSVWKTMTSRGWTSGLPDDPREDIQSPNHDPEDLALPTWRTGARTAARGRQRPQGQL